MEVVTKYVQLFKARDFEGLLALVDEEAHYKTPKWETKGKAALKKQMSKDSPPEFYGETELVETPEGKFTRTLKFKVAMVVTVKLRQTFTVADKKVTSMLMERV
eukprot:TRINITY_DN608_c3_g1_i1.p1 TRINITY_DN608_c3_g1~~TRINITY_DN608_c3_g1_i1.p1  ORF type:complete len:120 (+),score=53.72 TRINITY_DN608_c3_g1_i1:49-360(+)